MNEKTKIEIAILRKASATLKRYCFCLRRERSIPKCNFCEAAFIVDNIADDLYQPPEEK